MLKKIENEEIKKKVKWQFFFVVTRERSREENINLHGVNFFISS